MTGIATALASLAAAGALAVGAALAPGADHPAPRTAVVIDAPAARDGRALVDPRLRAVDADVRLPRNAAEARTDVALLRRPGLRPDRRRRPAFDRCRGRRRDRPRRGPARRAGRRYALSASALCSRAASQAVNSAAGSARENE